MEKQMKKLITKMLALLLAVSSINMQATTRAEQVANSNNQNPPSSGTIIGATVGGAIGGVLGIITIVAFIKFLSKNLDKPEVVKPEDVTETYDKAIQGTSTNGQPTTVQTTNQKSIWTDEVKDALAKTISEINLKTAQATYRATDTAGVVRYPSTAEIGRIVETAVDNSGLKAALTESFKKNGNMTPGELGKLMEFKGKVNNALDVIARGNLGVFDAWSTLRSENVQDLFGVKFQKALQPSLVSDFVHQLKTKTLTSQVLKDQFAKLESASPGATKIALEQIAIDPGFKFNTQQYQEFIEFAKSKAPQDFNNLRDKLSARPDVRDLHVNLDTGLKDISTGSHANEPVEFKGR